VGVGRRGLRTANTKPFRFCSVFKFEARKGWDMLLAAYLQVRSVCLVCLRDRMRRNMHTSQA
jgi:hypothetical protein